MENNIFSNEQPPQNGCLNCGSSIIVQGYKNPLCQECRTMFIKFPIPKLIKIFGVVILAVLILSMSKIQKNLMAAVHLKRGEKAEKKGDYFTAQKEFEKTIALVPRLQEANCHLMIASFHNMDYETVFKMSEELDGKNIEEHGMYVELSEIIRTVSSYYPTDSFNSVFETYKTIDSIPEVIFKSYIQKHPDEIFPITRYTSILLDKERYQECDALLDNLLKLDKGYLTALGMKAGVKRELKQFDSAHYYCDRMLLFNKESTFGVSSKARTFLKQKKDKEGLVWAQKSIDIDKYDPYSMATLAIAYHFNNKIEERNKLIGFAEKDSAGILYMQYAKDIISGKDKFRD